MTKTALITGASRGLGAALAKALAPTHHIIAVGKTVGALEELDDAITAAGSQATLAPMDITVDDAMQQLCRSIFDRWGGLDLWLRVPVSRSLALMAAQKPRKWRWSTAGPPRRSRPAPKSLSSPPTRCPRPPAHGFSRAKIARRSPRHSRKRPKFWRICNHADDAKPQSPHDRRNRPAASCDDTCSGLGRGQSNGGLDAHSHHQ